MHAEFTDFKVADLSLAEFGRQEITLAEHEMLKVEGPYKPDHYRC